MRLAFRRAAELVVTGEFCSFVGKAGSLVLQFFSAGGDFGGAALYFGEFDEPTLVEVDEAASFGVGGVDLAVQPGQSPSAPRSPKPDSFRVRSALRRVGSQIDMGVSFFEVVCVVAVRG